MTKKIIINISALAQPQKDVSIPARITGLVNENLARQWLSIASFAKIYTTYAPQASSPLSSCCGFFYSPVCSVAWVMSQINWELISQYKSGSITTGNFLNMILRSFPFLENAQFTDEEKERLFKKREQLTSLEDFDSIELISSTMIAKALLEEAWVARMQFDEITDNHVNLFFENEKGHDIYMISNSNEMDVRETLRYLTMQYPAIDWRTPSELNALIKVPDKPLEEGIQMTKEGAPSSVKLYLSYTHSAFKTGQASESTMKTDALLQLLMDRENLDSNQVTLISQWKKDREKAKSLGINTFDAATYFSSLSAHLETPMMLKQD